MPAAKHEADGLNEHHLRRLLVACQHIDRLLSEIEGVLESADSKSVFPRYILDVSAAERAAIEGYIARVRQQLLKLVRQHGLSHKPAIPATRAIHSALSVIQISAEELNLRYLRGYGQVPEKAAAQLKPLVRELQELAAEFDHYVRQSRCDTG